MKKPITLLILLFTLCLGRMRGETIPAGTIIYVDVTNFHSDKSGYATDGKYYMSVTASDNMDKPVNKSNTSGANWDNGYDARKDTEWQELTRLATNFYAGVVENESTVGSVSFWRKELSLSDHLWEVDACTPNMWNSKERKFTITSGYTHHDDRHVAGFSATTSMGLYPPGSTLYLKVNSNWKEGSARFAACFCGVAGQTWVNCSQVGSSDYYSVTVPEGEWPMVIFCRMKNGSDEERVNKWGNMWDQTDDLFYEYDKNLCSITAEGWSHAQTRGQYAPNGAIHGSMNSWVMMSFNSFNGDGELKLELGANTAYEFQVISDESWYGYGDANFKHTLVGQTAETTLSTGGKDILILTADAGEYTFNWDKSSHELSVTYPNLPNSTNLNPNYVYVKNTYNWSPVNAHLWGGYNGTVWENDPALSSIDFNSTTYHYAATGYESSIIFGQGVNDEHKTGNLTISEGKGKYYDPSTTSWKWFSSRITLNNQSATSAGTEYKDAELFNTALTTKITCPTKTGYLFGGYFTATGGGGVQIIEDDGDWIASVSGYTNSSTQWVRANTELFAKWTPIVYSIRYNTNGGDGGSMSNSSHTYDVAKALTSNGFTKTGYSFAGWATSAGGSVAYSNGQSVSNLSSTDGATVDLFAKWTPNPYTITLNNHDATSAGTSGVNVTFDANTNLTSAITIPKKTGYGFHGYYTEESGAGTQIIDAEGNFIAGAGSNAYLDGSKNWKHANNITLHAYWVASAVTTPTVTASMPAYIGEDITITLSATSTNVAEPVVIFYVTDNSVSKTYEVVATPGAIGDAPSYSTTHTATFKTDHAATYSVTAKVYSGKLIDNFDGALAHWKGVDGGTFVADETNPAMQAGNGSNTVMKIIRGDGVYKTVQTKQAADNSATTDWNLDYGYIYISMYSTTARSTKMKYSDNYSTAAEVTSSDISASTWTRVKFTVGSGHQVDYILPFMPEEGTMYIDDIILSNESSMTAQATSSSASTTITQPTIGSCTATAATTNWGGSNINISLSAQTTYLADAVVVFFVTDGSNSTTYEVTATPGTPGANNAITHTATFVAQHAATYSVTAKLYNGKFIDNFEGSASAWSGLGYGTCERVSNVEREADNGSTKVMKITRSVEKDHGETYQTAWTTTAENSGTKTSWGHEYSYIHMRYYAPQEENPEVEYWDDGESFRNTPLSSQTANTWHELVFAVDGGVVNYIHPFVLSGEKTDGHYIYIDDIILSNRSTWAPIKNTSGVDLTADASDVTIRDEYTVTLNNDHGGEASDDGSATATYDATSLSSITHAQFSGWTLLGYWNSSAVQVTDENGDLQANVDGYTDGSAKWTKDGDANLWAHWSRSVSLDREDGTTGSTSMTVIYKSSTLGSYSAPTKAGYAFAGYYTDDNGTGTLVINTSGVLQSNVTGYTNSSGEWTKADATTLYAKWTPVTLTFTGATDSDWSTLSNWSPACVPTIDHDVVITKPVTVDIAHATAKSVVIYNNGDTKTGKLTIQANKGLEVAGTITRTTDGSDRLATREEDLVLESSSAGNASLIFDNSNSAQATVQMYSKASISGSTWNWQYVGTPFTGSIPLYNYYGSWMYKWYNGGWDVVTGSETLDPFAGYCLTQSSATTHVMGGTLVSTTSSGSISIESDMVLANSWTAPIYIGGFTEETFTSEPATIYLFNTGSAEGGAEPGQYTTVTVHAAEYTGDEFIAPMQGFFVTNYNGKNGSITLNYNDLVRPSGVHTGIVAGPMKMRKQEETKPAVLKMWANGTEYNDRVVILAREDFSEGFDNGWDGKKMSFGVASPSVYVINAQGGYDAVSAIPDLEGTVVGFRAGANNSCTLTFDYDGEETLYLNDLQAQQSTLIDKAQTYTFSTSSYDSEARFIISATPITKITTGIENDANDANDGMMKVRKIIINDKLFIIRSGRMYDATGIMVK